MNQPTNGKLLFVNKLQALLVRLHANPMFEWTTIFIILMSSLTIGVKSYSLSDTAELTVITLDRLVTAYFLIELILRLIVAGGMRPFFRAGWNIFDFLIVTASLIPVDESEYALLARLLRLFRVMRLIYFVPQLRVLVGALFTAIPRISYVVLMMFIIFYIYAAVGNLMFERINPTLWGDIGVAMLTLFRVATFEDWTDVMYETMVVHPFSWLYYLSFIFLSAFVFLNMMIGVIIDALNEEHNKEVADGQYNTSRQLDSIENRLISLETDIHRISEAVSNRPPLVVDTTEKDRQ